MKFDANELYYISSKFEGSRVSLYDLAIWRNGLAFKKIDFSPKGLPVIKIAELNNGISNSTAYTEGEYPKEYFLTKGDLLFSWSGNPDTSIDVFKYTLSDGWLNQHIFKVDCNENLVDKQYLFYILKFLKPNFSRIAKNKQTTGLGHVTVADLKKISLILPRKEVQKKIAKILSALDDKIELNNRINKNLEAQAQAIYKHMFVNNNGYKFKKGVLGEIAEIIMGQSPSGSTYNERGIGSVFFQGRAEFGERFPSIRLYTTEPNRMACANDVLMSVRAPVGDLNIAHDNCCIGRGLAAIRSKTNHQSFVLYTLLSLKRELEVFNGEGTVFGSINRDSLKNIPVIIPEIQKIDEFEKLVSPIDAIIRNNYDEICTLKQTRDTLLPKLMSGELDVSSIDLGAIV